MLVKNKDNKTVCDANEKAQTVVIVKGLCKTIIRFDKNGKMKVINTRIGDKEYEKRRA